MKTSTRTQVELVAIAKCTQSEETEQLCMQGINFEAYMQLGTYL